MKTLKLKALELGGDETLSREQLKSITGGVIAAEYCCGANGKSFCDASQSLVVAWAEFWSTAGYSVTCFTMHPVQA